MFTLGVVFAATSLLAVLAAPASELQTRSAQFDGHLFVCTDANWQGNCENIGFFNNQCVEFSSAFQNDISSLGPDAGWECLVYFDNNCNNDQGEILAINPGYPDLSQIEGDNDAVSSFSCFPSEFGKAK